MRADDASVRVFLSNYFDAEASVVDSMRSIEISTASPILIQQLSSLLRRFGIWMRLSEKRKRATNGSGIYRNYYIGILGGNAARIFRREIGFCDPQKQTRLEKICEYQSNTNVEEVFYCRIKSVEDTEYDGWVYDFEVAEHHNFIANNILCHNTIQVLALLESRRQLRQSSESRLQAGVNGKRKKPPKREIPNDVPPSLAVVPKSLVFNWKQEAARFAPKLRVLDHTGHTRGKESLEHFDDYDLILTTYGTLRNDAILFKDTRFDYVILDETQAIKNADTASSKATRLLNSDYRLALSGTPIENHLGELWSLFEFLNPGMLGAASGFKLSGAGARNAGEETRKLLAQALRPFILRRTKSQVAKDLPEKQEQTIFCELEPAQRKLYNELRDHYRNLLLDRVAREGIAKSKMHALEALLRLRQAALHPGLIDKKRVKEDSAKLDLLLPQLIELFEEGHKVLVFSQFTSFLSILRGRLDKEKLEYEYLDGSTRNRQARVERFQNDPDCKLFLISLKAGGLGLNLTAAEYVYLLDPWWNPAVEAQAIDRAHRIGQTRQVFAYRIIARDTVEEKVLALQNTKRDLADAIINADNSLIRNLSREDLELLLS
jgi:SNF2 family DNA or RNA helicase